MEFKPKPSNPNVITRIVGGLGNQLFTYAAARRLAVMRNAELIIDDESFFSKAQKYPRSYQLDHFNIHARRATRAERLEPLSWLRRNLLRSYNANRVFQDRSYIQEEGLDFDPRLLDVKVRNTTYLDGYWQSEGYFKDIESLIRDDLQIKPPCDSHNAYWAANIHKEEAVAVHVRFYDTPESNDNNNIPANYYVRAMAMIDSSVSGARYFVFSDNAEAAHSLIGQQSDRVSFVNVNEGDHHAYADLWLMSLCKHFIIANSTFSWWGAWLGESERSIVISPSRNSASEIPWGFDGLLPSRWHKI